MELKKAKDLKDGDVIDVAGNFLKVKSTIFPTFLSCSIVGEYVEILTHNYGYIFLKGDMLLNIEKDS